MAASGSTTSVSGCRRCSTSTGDSASIRAEALAARPANEPFDLAEVYSDLSRQGKLAGYEVTTRFYEIGSAAGLKETDALLRNQLA